MSDHQIACKKLSLVNKFFEIVAEFKCSRIPVIQHPEYQIGAILSDTTYTDQSFSYNFFTALRECALVRYFHSLIKRLSFLVIINVVMVFLQNALPSSTDTTPPIVLF